MEGGTPVFPMKSNHGVRTTTRSDTDFLYHKIVKHYGDGSVDKSACYENTGTWVQISVPICKV